MCGITGYWDRAAAAAEPELEATARAMADRLVHRGPDSAGAWADAAAGVALGHRRLAIVDLSAEGHQPMASRSGRWVVAYNGEIYNHAALRAELAALGHAFRGQSDTETLLAAFEQWGVEGAVTRFVGMFAFGAFDREARTLHLGRDRMGEKPLYYGWVGGRFVFASDPAALTAAPGWTGAIDRGAIALLLRHNCIPAPYSIYEGIRKLEPGRLLTVGPTGAEVQHAYWSLAEVARAGLADPLTDEAEAADALEALLRQAVAGQMMSDVPLGAFLSGGIDSSLIVALMQAQSDRPVKTFTIGLPSAYYDESAHAEAVARHLGTDHTTYQVTEADGLALVPRLPAMFAEPFADSSQIPTHLVASLARRHVTVSLSGDAGDELFAGYNRYAWVPRVWRRIAPVPQPVRALAARGIAAVPPTTWDAAYGLVDPLLPARLRQRLPGYKLHKVADALDVRSPDELYRRMVSHWPAPAAVVKGATLPPTLIDPVPDWAALPTPEERMMLLDALTYLPDDILVKLDRTCMAASLESRAPFLDHRVVAFAWRVPLAMKLRDGQGKRLLRRVLYRHVPEALIERPKIGFGVPLEDWLRGPLREWAEDLLSAERLRREGYFEPQPIRALWEEHLGGRRNWQYHLWDVLSFQAWLAARGQG